MRHKIIDNLIQIFLCLIGFFYIFIFFSKAVIDVPVSDYIRIINYYIDDVSDLHYLFSIEGISRIPITFLMRYINVTFFNYSTNFDRMISLISLTLLNFILLKYVCKIIKNNVLKVLSMIFITMTVFSLISWEMILNGTAYPHYLCMLLFIIIFLKFDYMSNEKYFIVNDCGINNNQINYYIIFLIFVIITSLCFSGSYQVSFLFTICFFSFVYFLINFLRTKKIFIIKQKINIFIILIGIFCVVSYYISDNFGEPFTHIGMQEIDLISLLIDDILFPLRFLLKSFASSFIGVDNFIFSKDILLINNNTIYIIGIIVIVICIFSIFIFFMKQYYKKYCFISLLLFYGLSNFFFVFFARYKFVNEDYGMTSRYNLQYMWLIISIILIMFKVLDDYYNKNSIKNIVLKQSNKYLIKHIICFFDVFILVFIFCCFLITNYHEQILAPYRKENYERAKEVALSINDYDISELSNIFEYKRSSEQIIKAFDILNRHNLNIFNDVN